MQDFAVDFDPTTVCRFCLDHEWSMEPLFSLESVPEVVAKLTELEISSDDSFSKLICEQCATFARSMLEFRQKCIESHDVHKEWLESKILADEEQTSSPHKVDIEYIEEDERGSDTREALSEDEAQLEEFTVQMIEVDGGECELCKEHISGGEEMMKLHKKTDHPEGECAENDELPKPCKCVYCPKAYASYELLGLHLIFHQRDQWHCPQCDIVVEDKEEFVDHLRTHATDGGSGEEFDIPLDASIETDHEYGLQLEQHEEQMEESTETVTEVESTEPEAEVESTEPVIEVESIDSVIEVESIDSVIEVESIEPVKSRKRKRTKSPVVPTQFVECGKHIHSDLQDAINRHRQMHVNDAANESLQTEGKQKKIFLCNICGHNCKSAGNLAVHLRRHNGQFVCHCSHCGKGFPRNADLKSHMRQHTGEKPFVCRTCGRGFARQDKLSIHLRTHTGEKPYGCPCGRSFAQRNDLKIHQKRNSCGQNFDVSKMITPKVSICIVSPPSSP